MTTMYQCAVCKYLTPRLPHSPHQVCPHCEMDYDTELDAQTSRWAEIVVSMLIGLMMGFILGRAW